jgi:hypothetical protein
MCGATGAGRTINAIIGVNDAIFVVARKSSMLLASRFGRFRPTQSHAISKHTIARRCLTVALSNQR